MYSVEMEKQLAAKQKEAELKEKREDACTHTWGHCDAASPVYFGKPTGTPHTCKGIRKHISKLHVCESCGSIGQRNTPTPYSAAGRQLRNLILARAKQNGDRSAVTRL